MKKIILLILLVIIANAEIKTFTKTIHQTFAGAQSPDDARLSAIKKCEADISRETGEYISTYTVLKNSKMASDEVTAISASIMKTKVISEKVFTEGSSFGLELIVQATLDTNTIDAQIEKILGSKENLATIQSLQKQNQDLLNKIQSIELQNIKATTKQEKANIKNKFDSVQDTAKAIDWFKKGYNAALNNQIEESIEYFTNAIKLNPTTPAAYYNRALAYSVLGYKEKAIRDYTQEIINRPNNAEAYNNRGILYNELNDSTKAIEDYTQAIAINSNYAESYANRGNVYAKLGELTKAEKDFTKTIKINPNHVRAYFNRGIMYRDLKNDTKAISNFTKVIAIDPNHERAYTNRAIVFLLSGKMREATSDAKKACSLGNCELFQYMTEEGWVSE